MSDKTIHHMRPGRIGGTQVLCEQNNPEGYVAELSMRGVMTVNCPSCLGVLAELGKLYGFTPPAGMNTKGREGAR